MAPLDKLTFVSEDQAPTAPGWYPLPNTTERHPQVGYWDGSTWTGAQRRASRDGTRPKDSAGQIALILLAAGFVGTIAIPFVGTLLATAVTVSAPVAQGVTLIILAATPVALILSIVGLVRGHEAKVQAPASLVALILSTIGTVFLALPIALFVTGVWILPHI